MTATIIPFPMRARHEQRMFAYARNIRAIRDGSMTVDEALTADVRELCELVQHGRQHPAWRARVEACQTNPTDDPPSAA